MGKKSWRVGRTKMVKKFGGFMILKKINFQNDRSRIKLNLFESVVKMR